MKKLLLASVVVFSATAAAQQLKVPAPSPQQTIRQSFALSDIMIEYSRPGAKNRVVFGDLVPYNEMWRTGANASTKIAFGEDVKVEGTAITSGTYALYSIPGKDKWEILFYKDLTLGGNTADYKKENEVARITVKPSALAERVETMTFNISDMTPNSARINLEWENTRVSLNVTSEIDERVMKGIDKALEKDTRPFYQAASYYYDNNKDLNKAAEWVNKATEQNPKGYWIWTLKSKIHARQGNKKEALAAAEKANLLAREAKDDNYIRQTDKLIADNKK
jgi:tetratricopeptide (TPR) repeat protein